MKITRRAAVIAGTAAAAIAVTAGCSNQLNDLNGISQHQPNYATTWLNVSGFPNITELCINGVAFATTTRDYTSIMRIPQWDAFCQGKIGQTADTGQAGN